MAKTAPATGSETVSMDCGLLVSGRPIVLIAMSGPSSAGDYRGFHASGLSSTLLGR